MMNYVLGGGKWRFLGGGMPKINFFIVISNPLLILDSRDHLALRSYISIISRVSGREFESRLGLFITPH